MSPPRCAADRRGRPPRPQSDAAPPEHDRPTALPCAAPQLPRTPPSRRVRTPNGAADGFTITPPWLPGGFEVLTDEVVPLLRARGRSRTEYTGAPLREHHGLPRPDSLYAAPREPATTQPVPNTSARS